MVGVARRGTSNDALRESLLKGLKQYATRPVDDVVAARLLECVTCIEADPSDPSSFDAMAERLQKLEANRSTGGNRLFYLATPPTAFAPIARDSYSKKRIGRGSVPECGTTHPNSACARPPSCSLSSPLA